TSSYGTFGREAVVPVIDRVGESRTNDEVAAGLAERFGYDPVAFDPDPARLLRLSGHADLAADVHDPATGGWRPVGPGPQAPVRIRLTVDVPGVDRVPTYRPLHTGFPLTLLSPASPQTINSMFGER